MLFPFLRLIRLPNLLIMGLTMFFVRYYLILPLFLITRNINPSVKFLDLIQFSRIDFCIMVMGALCIAAAGNLINDYFDRRIDEVNKPDKIIIGKKISEKSAMNLYWLLNAAGLFFTAFIAIKNEVMILLFLNVLAAALLYFYSWKWKRIAFLGNLVIAFLAGLIPLLPAFAEKEFYVNFGFAMVYALFAFLLTLVREIIKDIEDIEGDKMEQCKTIPILLGMNWAKAFALLFLFAALFFIFSVLLKNFSNNSFLEVEYLLFFSSLPFLILSYLIFVSYSKKEFHFISMYIKGLMILGILTMIPFYHIFLS